MATENESPAREPATRGRGRGGRGGRGRGRGGGRGASTAVSKAAAATKTGRGGSRRGRAKNFADSRVQAAYERQRDLKANYQAVAHALKPALQELADRTIDDLLNYPDFLKETEEYAGIHQTLRDNLDDKLAEIRRHYEMDLKLAEENHLADNYVAEQEFVNGYNEVEELMDQSLDNQARILDALHAKSLPVDVRDDQYEYKVISDEHYDKDFRVYNCMKDGQHIPYPSRVEGTDMWRKAKAAEAALIAAAAAAPAKGKGRGRGANKRKPQEQPEGQPTPKKSTRSTEDLMKPLPPFTTQPSKGLLASAAEVEVTPEGTPEESVPASPEPPTLSNGAIPIAFAKPQGKLSAREKSPPLPKNISDLDEYGFRVCNPKPSTREKASNSRFLAPAHFSFGDQDIGFRDSTNDPTKSHLNTVAKRGKYLNNPNSNGFFFDPWCNGYDYSQTTPADFDKEMVKLYGVHPKYGILLPGSTPVDSEERQPYTMPGKPVVYIANPSGRIHHASRSYQKTTNCRRSEDNPWRAKIGASMRRFCKIADIDPDEIDVSNYARSDEQLREASLGTAVRELEARPVISEETSSEVEEPTPEEEVTPQPEQGFSNLSVLTFASVFLEAQESTKAAPPTARYDAIRDVFTNSRPTPAPVVDNPANSSLNILAELSNVVNRSDGPLEVNELAPRSHGDATIPDAQESDLRSTITRTHDNPVMAAIQPPTEPRYNPAEVPQGYMQAPSRGQPPMQPAGPVHPQPTEVMSYPPIHDHAVTQQPQVRPVEYHHPPPGPPIQDQGGYMQHGGYPIPDHRDVHMSAGRPMDPGYAPRRMSAFAAEPSYTRPFWQQQPPPGPPTSAGPAPGPAPAQHYQSQPQPPSRIPFSHNASAEPLPPLRPPRGRNHSVQEESMMEPSMRPVAHNSLGGNYYSPRPSQPYHRGFATGPESHTLQPISTERILPNPQQTAQGYMTSPHQGYAPQVLSPTYANAPSMAGQMAQSPQEAPQGLPSSVHRHRSTPSGSSDAGNGKYRKLQPAPVPAHRVWPNKPELKTIPYDHKETGSAAALPSSGPTQIRGWNVNQPRKRGKTDKNDRSEPSQDREESR